METLELCDDGGCGGLQLWSVNRLSVCVCVCAVTTKSTKSTRSTATGTTRKLKPQNKNRNDQQPHHHQQAQKAQGAKSRQDHITITNIHKQTQDKTLIRITNLSGGAAPAVPNAKPTSPHKKTANAMLEAGICLAEAHAEFSENARDKLLLCEEAVSARDGQVSNVPEQAHHGRAQAPKGLHGEGCEAICAPFILAVLRPLLGVPLGGGSPAVPCRAWVDNGGVPHLELIGEHVEDVSSGFGTG
jgi:hypothetical protein